MAFCTECGYKLPQEAVFCPNCGSSLRAPQSDEIEPQPKDTEDVIMGETVSPTPDQTLQAGSEKPFFQTSGVYVESGTANAVPPVANIYPPAPDYGYTPQNQSTYMPPQNQCAYPPPPPQYSAPASYGYPSQTGGTVLAEKPQTSGGMVAAIVISSVVVLLALAAILIFKPFGGSSSRYLGYWETVAVDVGDGVISKDYFGMSVVGALGIQLNKDNSAYLASASDYEVREGTWHETEDGIQIDTEEDNYLLFYEEQRLVLSKEGEIFYFEKIRERDINNPTVPRGSLSSDTGMDGDDEDSPGVAVSGSGYVGDGYYFISVIGAEEFTDIDGDPAIRIYYEFTNYNEEAYSVSAWDVLSVYARQDGQDLMPTYSADYNSNSYAWYNIRPGVTLQCTSEYKYNPNGGSVDFSLSGYQEGDGVVEASYTPGSLPGAPAPYVIVPITNPQWTLKIAADGALDDFYVRVADAELIEDYNGKPAIRVYYEFTNNGNYSTSMGDELYLYTYQDGISLDYTYASEDSDTDMNYYAETSPGETTYLSCIFLLRNQSSQVEAEVGAYYDYAAVGETYDIASLASY